MSGQKPAITSQRLILAVALFLLLFGNRALFTNLHEVYPLTLGYLSFWISLIGVFYGATVLLLALLCFGPTTKPVLIVILLLSSLASYFMDTYRSVIDAAMIENIVKTDPGEMLDLVSFKLFLYFSLFGLMPAIVVGRCTLVAQGLRQELWSRLKMLALLLVVLAPVAAVHGSYYASFLREHKMVRYYANPTTYVYSLIKYASAYLEEGRTGPLRRIGQDAAVERPDDEHELVVLVIGEAARADHFSLNGYTKKTNPRLEREDVISFTNFWSCGTSTAVSLPCMFSNMNSDEYDKSRASSTENALDVLRRVGVNLLWLDNNSSSKGVAARIPYQSYKSVEVNPDCDVECRDEGMLAHLQEYVDARMGEDILIVLHQMGNHGPAYYKRYPAAFEKFSPVCRSNQLETCTREEIENSYDNAILYTDDLLANIIALLQKNDGKFETTLWYISDHGESLGENGVYLHGLPKMIAPEVQLHVPCVFWFGARNDDVDLMRLREGLHRRVSQDYVFHTLLGLFEVESSVYDPRLDLLRSQRRLSDRTRLPGHRGVSSRSRTS